MLGLRGGRAGNNTILMFLGQELVAMAPIQSSNLSHIDGAIRARPRI